MNIFNLGAKPESQQPEPNASAAPVPSSEWQAAARKFVEASAKTLWERPGADALAYLRARGMTDDEIRRARLGYREVDTTAEASAFGLEVEKDRRTGLPVLLDLPAGIVVPTFEGDVLMRVVVRRTNQHLRCDRCGNFRLSPGLCTCGAAIPRHRLLRGSQPANHCARYEVEERTATARVGTKLSGDEISALIDRLRAESPKG